MALLMLFISKGSNNNCHDFVFLTRSAILQYNIPAMSRYCSGGVESQGGSGRMFSWWMFFCHLPINIEIEDSRLGGKVLIFIECQRPPNDSTPLRSRDKQI